MYPSLKNLHKTETCKHISIQLLIKKHTFYASLKIKLVIWGNRNTYPS